MPDKFLRELVTILLSTFSHGVHIGTSCQVDAELDQSLGTHLSFHSPLMCPDRLVRVYLAPGYPDRLGLRPRAVPGSGPHTTILRSQRDAV